ncbi:MAG: glycosyltransferase family 9 protein [Vicinamibacteraceae bacterium]
MGQALLHNSSRTAPGPERRPAGPPNGPAILIVKLGALGDIVHTLPALAALRSMWPHARIDWLVDAKHLALVELVEGLDEIIPIRAGRMRGPLGLRQTIGRLRARRYDMCLDLQGLVKSALLAVASGARRVVGFPRDSLREPAARFLYTETGGRDEGHVIDKNLSLLDAIGVLGARNWTSHLKEAFPLRVVASPVPAVARGLTGTNEGLVLMNPGAAWPNKRWPAERFAALAQRLQTRRAVRCLVLWGPREESLAASIERLSHGTARMAPATEVADLVALARDATLMVSGDTGPLHLAVAVGAPVVGLYGPTDPARNGPWHPNDITLSRYAACQCRFKRRCRSAEWCLAGLTVDEVEAAVIRRLRPAGGAVGAG